MLGSLGEPKADGPDVHSRRIWDAASGRELARLPEVGDDSGYANEAISTDGTTYAVPPRFDRPPGEKVRNVRVWKAAWGGEVREFPGVAPIARSGDRRFLAAAGGPVDQVRGTFMESLVYDVDSGKAASLATPKLDPYGQLAVPCPVG